MQFPCPVDGCGGEFTQKSNLQSHIRSVHGGERVRSMNSVTLNCVTVRGWKKKSVWKKKGSCEKCWWVHSCCLCKVDLWVNMIAFGVDCFCWWFLLVTIVCVWWCTSDAKFACVYWSSTTLFRKIATKCSSLSRSSRPEKCLAKYYHIVQ